MVQHIDHVTIAVNDLATAQSFFALLGFREAISTTISGAKFAAYMRVLGIEARHVTLVLEGSSPRFEIQLLHYLSPRVLPDTDLRRLDRLGFNHVCFAVADLDAEVARLTAAGVKLANEPMEFHDRKLVFLTGPEGVTVELAQWTSHPA